MSLDGTHVSVLNAIAQGGSWRISSELRVAVKAAMEEVEKLQASKRGLLERETSWENERLRLTKQVSDEVQMRATGYARMTTAEKVATDLMGERDTLLGRVKQLQVQVREKAAEAANATALRQERDGLKNELEKLRQSYGALSKVEFELRGVKDELATERVEAERLRKTLDQVCEERDEATHEKSRFALQAQQQAQRAEQAERSVAAVHNFIEGAKAALRGPIQDDDELRVVGDGVIAAAVEFGQYHR